MIFQAGYISNALSNLLDVKFPNKAIFRESIEDNDLLKMKGLLESVSNFDIQFPSSSKIDYLNIHPILAVQNNILSRGVPTLAPLIVEDILSDLGITVPVKHRFKVAYELKDNIKYSNIFETLHLIYPKIKIERKNYLGKLDSELEWKFLNQAPQHFRQIFQSQRLFNSISKNFPITESRVDFSFTIPYVKNSNKNSYNNYETLVFEIDGPHHLLTENIIYDQLKDNLVQEANGSTLRFNQFQILHKDVEFDKIFDESINKIYLKNYNKNVNNFINEYLFTLLPFSVARIQKCLIEIFNQNPSLLSETSLNLAILERDIPGGALALKAFQDSINHLNTLVKLDSQLRIPQINLTLFQNNSFKIKKIINKGYPSLPIEQFKADGYDIVIDNSILIRKGTYKFEKEKQENFFTIRSSHYVENSAESLNVKYCAESLKFHPLVIKQEDTSYTKISKRYPSMQYFLNDIFRMKDYRDGQLPIISRALQKLPVIGLLPTGGGKSLTYQITTFLQPTLTVVVDPIKALMEDQVRVLRENWIDSATYVNSSQGYKQKNRNLVDFKLGLKQIIFVSPERFVIDNFRQMIEHIYSTKKGQSIGYCVIDEVHCLSEWGHDFRYDYLMLGKNAQKYCYTRDTGSVSLIGLTATATFDVLADIERELHIDASDTANATIMIENSIRPELFYRVVRINSKDNRSEIIVNEIQNREAYYKYFNNPALLKKSQQHHFINFEPLDFCRRNEDGSINSKNGDLEFEYFPNMENTGNISDLSNIVFCAVKGIQQNEIGEFSNKNGVRHVTQKLNRNDIPSVYFHGSDDLAQDNNEEEIKQKNFEDFLNGSVNTMVCTKAFGMGIDKNDVGFTYHLNYSGSMESLIQECGRAGRNKKTAVSTILVNPTDYYELDYMQLPNLAPGLNSFQMWIVKQNLYDIKFDTIEEFLSVVNTCEFLATSKNGKTHNLNKHFVKYLKKIIPENVDKLLIKKSEDRDIHDFFFGLAFKGVEYERAHIFNFIEHELLNNDINLQNYFEKVFNSSVEDTFSFNLEFQKHIDIDYNDFLDKIKVTKDENNRKIIRDIFKYSNTIEEFWYNFKIKQIVKISEIDVIDRGEIESYFLSSRSEIETGRLIYRLHSIGLLKSYTKNYKSKIYECQFYKSNSIIYYIEKYQEFLKRYQSEITVNTRIEQLKTTLSFENDLILRDIKLILIDLVEFTMYEIADKRRKATDEIKRVITAAVHKQTEYEQNLFIKEETFFYFNAKYAKPKYMERGSSCSLLDDYRLYLDNKFNPFDLLQKYLDDSIIKNGTEQNNYKHLIGSCKKINYSLVYSELHKDWLLKLLNSFAMYSINNPSYRYEANEIIEKGFYNLFADYEYHKEDYGCIERIFNVYFLKLTDNIKPNNPSIKDIDLIKNKLLQDLQANQINSLIKNIN